MNNKIDQLIIESQNLFNKGLLNDSKLITEKIILNIALLSFFVHLLIIYLLKFNVIEFSSDTELLNNPISAIYTPFSFILIYEVYLLIYYLPKSFTTYITKQYEIITNIIIGYYFFSDFPDNWTFLGLSIIIMSGIYISRRESYIKSN